MEIVNGEESSIGVVTELATAKKMLATLLERYLSAVSVADTDTAKVARSNLNVIRAFINTKESESQIAPKDEIGNEDQKDKGSTAKKDFEKKSGWFTTVIREIYDNGGNNTNWDAFVNKFTKKLGVKSNELNADVIREALRCIVRQKVEKGVSPLNVEMPCDDDMKNEFFKRMLMSPEHSGAFDFCIRKVLETDLNCKDVDEKMLIEVRKGLALRTALSTVDSYKETSEAFLQKLNQQSKCYRVEFTAEEKTNACKHVALMKNYRSKIAPILGLEEFKDLLRILKDMNTEAVNNQLDSYKKYVQDEPSKGPDSVSFEERKTIGQIKAKLKSFIACNLGKDPFNFRMKRYMNTMIEIMRSVLTDPNTDKNNVDALVKKWARL